MSEISVQLEGGASVLLPSSTTVAEALKKLDRDLAKKALAAKVRGVEVDLTAQLDAIPEASGAEAMNEFMRDGVLKIEPILPEKREGLEVLRHSTAHLDRKSTRLNSSHRCISYAVFCLKKKTQT